MGVYGPHTQFKCLLEAMIFGTCKKNRIMYSQMRFQPYQSHSLTVTGLKGGSGGTTDLNPIYPRLSSGDIIISGCHLYNSCIFAFQIKK